jgi:hypothetical protein
MVSSVTQHLVVLLFPLVAKSTCKEIDMPCNTIQIANIELGAVRPEVLKAAVGSLGLSGDVLQAGASGNLTQDAGGFYVPSMRYAGGTLRVSGLQGAALDKVTAAVKRGYTRTLVTQQARRFGWKVKEGQNGKLLLQK